MGMTKVELVGKTVYARCYAEKYSVQGWQEKEKYYELEITAYSGCYTCRVGYFPKMPLPQEVMEAVNTKENLFELFDNYLEENDAQFWKELVQDDPEITVFGELIEF